jgi:hypothetical protein
MVFGVLSSEENYTLFRLLSFLAQRYEKFSAEERKNKVSGTCNEVSTCDSFFQHRNEVVCAISCLQTCQSLTHSLLTDDGVKVSLSSQVNFPLTIFYELYVEGNGRINWCSMRISFCFMAFLREIERLQLLKPSE